jgi:hypothetical protein
VVQSEGYGSATFRVDPLVDLLFESWPRVLHGAGPLCQLQVGRRRDRMPAAVPSVDPKPQVPPSFGGRRLRFLDVALAVDMHLLPIGTLVRNADNHEDKMEAGD